jgi:hypothetical protein
MVVRVTHRRSDNMAETSRPRRVLVISNETVEADILHATLVAHADATEVVVVAPALNTRFRHWLSDEDPARHAAQRRVDGCLAALTRAGVRVDGWVGDADPLQAIAPTRSWCSTPTNC